MRDKAIKAAFCTKKRSWQKSQGYPIEIGSAVSLGREILRSSQINIQIMKYEGSKNISDEKLKEIYNALEGEDITSCQYAIRYCVVNGVSDERIISDLKKLKNDGSIKIVKMSCLAAAALDILGAEKYKGTDGLTEELINTKFFTAKQKKTDA